MKKTSGPSIVNEISVQRATVRDSLRLKEILEVREGDRVHLFQIAIKSDPFDFQSTAEILHFRGGEWVKLFSLLPTLMRTPSPSVARAKRLVISAPAGRELVESAAFAEDRAELLRVALSLLAG